MRKAQTTDHEPQTSLRPCLREQTSKQTTPYKILTGLEPRFYSSREAGGGLTTCPRSCWCSLPSSGAPAGGVPSQGSRPRSPEACKLEGQAPHLWNGCTHCPRRWTGTTVVAVGTLPRTFPRTLRVSPSVVGTGLWCLHSDPPLTSPAWFVTFCHHTVAHRLLVLPTFPFFKAS